MGNQYWSINKQQPRLYRLNLLLLLHGILYMKVDKKYLILYLFLFSISFLYFLFERMSCGVGGRDRG